MIGVLRTDIRIRTSEVDLAKYEVDLAEPQINDEALSVLSGALSHVEIECDDYCSTLQGQTDHEYR